jgi:chromatin remodeling complex protein RSC6
VRKEKIRLPAGAAHLGEPVISLPFRCLQPRKAAYFIPLDMPAKKKANSAFMKPMTPDDVLAAVIGSKPQPRTAVVKAIWDYIKKNNLQDKKAKTMINADDKLKAVFGGKKQVSMFEMTKLVNAHLS